MDFESNASDNGDGPAARQCEHAVCSGRSIVLRELLPQDLKLEVEELGEADAVKAARFLALVVGQAHARQMDVASRKSWLDDLLGRAHSKSLCVPSWLWFSVIELMGLHEPAYL
ncbi:DUF2252 family protein [Caballeronia mineralivorans]|uniref:DUF2252 family protein n=1 Tax=Caballeronia mineralivorans TaxID=2010198 RepID=UPI002AFEF0C3|nr:DUF2252 family protein [Caballeronia mineralivorans]